MRTNYEIVKTRTQFLNVEEAYAELVKKCDSIVDSKILKTGMGYQFDGYPRSKEYIEAITKPETKEKVAEAACQPEQLETLSRVELVDEVLFLQENH